MREQAAQLYQDVQNEICEALTAMDVVGPS